jgi:hypothetical protein
MLFKLILVNLTLSYIFLDFLGVFLLPLYSLIIRLESSVDGARYVVFLNALVLLIAP